MYFLILLPAAACAVTTEEEEDVTPTEVEESAPTPIVIDDCGTGIVSGNEQCDDGNTANGDGCNEACNVDPGYVCSGQPSICTAGLTIIQGPGLNLSITDNGYAGTLASMTCVNLTSTLTGTVGSVSANFGVAHTYAGDLVFKLKSPAGTVVTLMSRPGAAESADNGADSPYGNAADLSISYPIEFKTGASTSAENMGNGLSNSQTVCKDGGICTFAPNRGAAAPGTLTTFNGQTAAGTWQFCAGDSAPGDTGTINMVTLKLTN
jgi:cysteine-rich repeat protein